MYLGTHYVNVAELDVTDLPASELVIDAKDFDGLSILGYQIVDEQTYYTYIDEVYQIDGTKDLAIVVGLHDSEYTITVENYFADTVGTKTTKPDFVIRGGEQSEFRKIIDMGIVWASDDAQRVKGHNVYGTDFSEDIDLTEPNLINVEKYANIYAGKGDDDIYGRDGVTTKIYTDSGHKYISLRDANDTIYADDSELAVAVFENGGTDTIVMDDDSSLYLDFRNYDMSDVSYEVKKSDLILSKSDKDKVVIKDGLKLLANPDSIEVDYDDGYKSYNDVISAVQASDPDRVYSTLGNSSSKKAQKIEGTIFDENIYTGKGADKVTLYGGEHSVTTGKGNDKIELKNSESYIYINKGDGNDTIELDWNSGAHIVFDDDPHPALSFEMNGNDLIMTATHEKLAGEKKAVSEKITIKDFQAFNAEDPKYVTVYVDGSDVPLEYLLEGYEVVHKGASNKPNIVKGTRGSDVFYGGNKGDVFSDNEGGNDVYYIGKGSTMAIDDEGNDKYYVSSINSAVSISDNEGNNTLQINGVKASDLHFHFDMDEDGNLIPPSSTGVPQTPFSFMTTSQVNSNVSKNTFANPFTLKYGNMSYEEFEERSRYGLIDEDDMDYDKVSAQNNVQGVSIANPMAFQNISVADKNGKNAVEISMSTIYGAYQGVREVGQAYMDRVTNDLGDIITDVVDNLGMLPEYLEKLNYYVAKDLVDTQVLLTEADEILATSSKGMTKEEKSILAYFKKLVKAIKEDVASIYNSVNMGSESDDTYTNVKGIYSKFLQIVEADNLAHGMPKAYTQMNKFIISGAGNDTYKFAKDVGTVLVVSSNKEMLGSSVPSTPIISSDRDTLVFSNYSLEGGTLTMDRNDMGYGSDISFNAYDISKVKGKYPVYPYMGTVGYVGLVDTYEPTEDNFVQYQAKALTVQDSKRSYDVNFVSNSLVNLGKDNKNHIALVDGAQVYLGKGYNFVMSTSDFGNDIYHGGGKDIYTLYGDSNDTYTVDFNKDTVVGIMDNGGNDRMKLTGNAHNMRMFFDYNLEYVDIDAVRIMDKSNMSAKNLSTIGYYGYGMSQEAIKSGLYVGGSIENWSVNDGNLDITNLVNDLASQVASWLSENNFESTYDVFENGSKAQIADLIAQYSKYDVADYVDYM